MFQNEHRPMSFMLSLDRSTIETTPVFPYGALGARAHLRWIASSTRPEDTRRQNPGTDATRLDEITAKIDGAVRRYGNTDIDGVMRIKRGKPFMAVDAEDQAVITG